MWVPKGKWGAIKANGFGAPDDKWGAKRQMDLGRQKANGFGNKPVAMKPDETAMNPWHEAKIKGNEPMA